MAFDDERCRRVLVCLSLWGDEEASLKRGDGVADPFMKLTSPPEQTTMVGEGGPVQRQSQPLIGLFGLYTAIGSRMQSYACTPTDSFFFSFYLELH